MIIITVAGASVVPVINFLIFNAIRKTNMDVGVEVNFIIYAEQTIFFITLLVGVLLYGLLATYTFSREYEDDTLKNLLTVPVGRTKLLLSKYLLILFWIMLLTILALVLCLLLSLIGGFGALSLENILYAFNIYILSGFFMFLLVMPIVFITKVFKSYVASIAFAIVIVIVSLVLSNSEYLGLYPWSAPIRILNPLVEVSAYPLWYSWASILLTGFISVFITIIYFNKQDIQ